MGLRTWVEVWLRAAFVRMCVFGLAYLLESWHPAWMGRLPFNSFNIHAQSPCRPPLPLTHMSASQLQAIHALMLGIWSAVPLCRGLLKVSCQYRVLHA